MLWCYHPIEWREVQWQKTNAITMRFSASARAHRRTRSKKLARKYHPDMNPGDKEAEEKFKEVNEANEVLSDPEKKARYDQFGFAGVDPSYGAGGPGGPGGPH